jgi:hypothetical protein
MEEIIKDQFRQFRLLLLNDIKDLIAGHKPDEPALHPEWIKSSRVRKLLDISPATLQNLRISGKIGYRKIGGSYYYAKTDLYNLFNKPEYTGCNR